MKEEINSDRVLLEKIKNGDIVCFELLYGKYSGKLYNYILRLSKGDFYLAEEIVQNVFIKIWEIRQHISTEGSFNSFVYTVGRNMFLNIVKSRIQEHLYHDYVVDHEDLLENSVEKEIEYKMLEEQINRLIELLPPARRNIYILSRVKNLPNKEIAVLLDISENTVESQLNKAAHFMRKNLIPYCSVLILGLILLF